MSLARFKKKSHSDNAKKNKQPLVVSSTTSPSPPDHLPERAKVQPELKTLICWYCLHNKAVKQFLSNECQKSPWVPKKEAKDPHCASVS